MTEKKGHYEKGVWVEDPVGAPAAAPAKEEHPIDVRIASATKSVISAMDDFAKVTRDLVTTEEGKKHIEKSVKDTTAHVQKSFEDILTKAKDEVENAKAGIEKAAAEAAKTTAPKK